MPSAELPTGTVTFLFTDIEGVPEAVEYALSAGRAASTSSARP